jgi:hypothetical protein
MKANAISSVFSLCLTLLCSTAAFSQDQAASESASTEPVAFVYVQLTGGVYVYAANTAGKLTLVEGSPFAVSGKMEDINGKYLVSVGTTNLHVYLIESNGAVGGQVSVLDTASYGGSECGSTTYGGSFLDHTGKYLYVQLDNGGGPNCAAWQSYLVEPDGTLNFIGDILYYSRSNGSLEWSSVPTVSSNDKFDYAEITSSEGYPEFAAFKKGSNGLMERNGSFFHVDPIADDGGSYVPGQLTADSNGHLGAVMQALGQGGDILNYAQLASYTIDQASGGIRSTNEYSNMPFLSNFPLTVSMSPSGKLIALGGSGIEVYHFNGAAPPTPFTGSQFSSKNFFLSAWDKSNHLYAVSDDSHVYAFTVTPTTFHESPGSPYALPVAYALGTLIVVPK